ncbi:MAG: preprotein translocase subunit SecD [Candidatus Peribacteria bacterium]|nr:preprotein translocase subunit SecD [Candidatus Peribacteria bacterium]
MKSNRSLLWPVITVAVAVITLLIALPDSTKKWAPGIFRTPQLHLGLDLAGGTQLDFRISEEEMRAQLVSIQNDIQKLENSHGSATEIAQLKAQEQGINDQKQNLVEAIRTVIERRINGLGVSEATITPSYVGNEKHLLVECPGLVNVQECIDVVGKTIQLQFKEEFTEATDDYIKSVKARADTAEKRVTASGETLKTVGQDIGSQLGTAYQDSQMYFKDTLPKGLEDVWTLAPGKVARKDGSVTVPQTDAQGKTTSETIKGIFLVEMLKPATATGRTIAEAPKAFALLAKTESGAAYTYRDKQVLDASVNANVAGVLRSMQAGDLKAVRTPDAVGHLLFLRQLDKGKEEMEASHILISYKGASNADKTVTRTKEEAKAKADAIRARLLKGEDFTAIAKAESDGPSRNDGGKLGVFSRGMMVPAFENAAFKLKPGEYSSVVETQFGFHIIKQDKPAVQTADKVSYDELTLKGGDTQKRADDLLKKLQAGAVKSTEDAITVRSIFFSFKPTGWKDTELDGKHFRSATVTLDPVANLPVVQIGFDTEGAKLFQQLTKKNINKRIAIFVGGQMVTAPVVNQEITGGTAVITGSANIEEAKRLATDLNTGAIPAPIHLVGQYSVEATLGQQALQKSLFAALVGVIILMLYMLVTYRFLGLIANIALVVYALLLVALMKLPLFFISSTYVVLTLAGMAGVILSLGMAVDANVLIYERLKEELRKGKLFKTAVESSYLHAWPAIRDGNVSTLITCAILFIIGTSIIRGFAITLGIGVLLSMFTAIVITRWILRYVATTKLAERTELFGVKRNK